VLRGAHQLLGGVTKETGIPEGFMGLDCGPKSIEENAQAWVSQNGREWHIYNIIYIYIIIYILYYILYIIYYILYIIYYILYIILYYITLYYIILHYIILYYIILYYIILLYYIMYILYIYYTYIVFRFFLYLEYLPQTAYVPFSLADPAPDCWSSRQSRKARPSFGMES